MVFLWFSYGLEGTSMTSWKAPETTSTSDTTFSEAAGKSPAKFCGPILDTLREMLAHIDSNIFLAIDVTSINKDIVEKHNSIYNYNCICIHMYKDIYIYIYTTI